MAERWEGERGRKPDMGKPHREGGTLVAGIEYSFALHMDQPWAVVVAAKRKRVRATVLPRGCSGVRVRGLNITTIPSRCRMAREPPSRNRHCGVSRDVPDKNVALSTLSSYCSPFTLIISNFLQTIIGNSCNSLVVRPFDFTRTLSVVTVFKLTVKTIELIPIDALVKPLTWRMI